MASHPLPGEDFPQSSIEVPDGLPQMPPQQQQQQQQQSLSPQDVGGSAAMAETDRLLLQQLLARYSPAELAREMEGQRRASHVSTEPDNASIAADSVYSSIKSNDASSSIFDGASIRTTASDPVPHRGSSLISKASAKFLGRKHHAASMTTTSLSSVDSADTDGVVSKQKIPFMCGLCHEEGIVMTCTRKNDLKRHIEDFHNMNAQWPCEKRGCGKVFDWQRAYKNHLKHAHNESRSNLDNVRIDLCPQTVFACGFESCLAVFEAVGDDDASDVFKSYVGHVVKHFDQPVSRAKMAFMDGNIIHQWTHSARIRALLKQAGTTNAWAQQVGEENARQLEWHPQSSVVLRKKLETRHLGDPNILVQYAAKLGSTQQMVALEGGEQQLAMQFGGDFTLPMRNTCNIPVAGHRNLANGGHIPNPAAPQVFRIPRGAPGPGSTYQNLGPAQRQMYSARRPVRSGRSARPPALAMRTAPNMPTGATTTTMPPTTTAAQYGYGAPGTPLYAAPNMQQQQQQQQQHQGGFEMMGQPERGVIADDLQSFQSIAGANGVVNDVEMGDSSGMMNGAGGAGAAGGGGGAYMSGGYDGYGGIMQQQHHQGGPGQGHMNGGSPQFEGMYGQPY